MTAQEIRDALDEVDPAASLLARIKTGAWLDRQRFAPLSWAVPRLIPEGFGLFTGPPKAGKSWASLDIALAVASGGRALGKVAVGDPRPVLLLALEDGDRRLQGRCRDLLGHEPIPERLHYVTAAHPADVPPLIAAWLAEHGDHRPLVVLDTLGKVMPPSLPGEGAYGRDYRIGTKLKALTDEHPGATLLVVHHVRKAGSDDWMDSTSGTNGLNGAADFTLSLSRARNENDGVLRVTGRDVPEGEYAVTVADGAWTLDGDDLADAANGARERRTTAGLGDRSAEIVRLAAKHPNGVRRSDVADALDMSPEDATRYLTRLYEAGRLDKPERGLYTPVMSVMLSLPEDGEHDTNDEHDTGAVGTCTDCGTPLHPSLAAAGDTTHPACGGGSS